MRLLVLTVVHDPRDARIRARQIAALQAAGHEVVYAAPFRDYGVTPPKGLEAYDVARAAGRRRVGALREARRLVRRLAPRLDLVLLHDPELVVATAGLGDRVPLVWDVHEDTVAAFADKPWLPALLRPAAARAVRGLERWAERRRHLLLAEDSYQARFARPHPVVPNTPRVPPTAPPPGDDAVVYVGRLSRLRGAAELIEVGRRLAGEVAVRLIGTADADVRPQLEQAHARGVVEWRGFVPNEEALAEVAGAIAGLSLLADHPNYRGSLPTKVLEYLSRGTPVVTTPLEVAREVVERYDAGVVVPFGDVEATVGAVRRLAADPALRRRMGAAGHAGVLADHNWDVDGPRFVSQLEAWAS